MKKRAKNKKPPGFAASAVGWEVSGACALASHPPGTENQNQK
jgi:hypothetical protein